MEHLGDQSFTFATLSRRPWRFWRRRAKQHTIRPLMWAAQIRITEFLNLLPSLRRQYLVAASNMRLVAVQTSAATGLAARKFEGLCPASSPDGRRERARGNCIKPSR